MTEIGWEDALEAMYGTQVSDKQVGVWEHYLREDSTNSAELVKAIDMAANEGIKPEEWRVTVRDLRKWLKIYRAQQNREKNREDNDARLVLFKSEWIDKLRRGAKRDDFLASSDQLGYGVVQRNEICKEVLEAVK